MLNAALREELIATRAGDLRVRQEARPSERDMGTMTNGKRARSIQACESTRVHGISAYADAIKLLAMRLTPTSPCS